MAGGIYEIRNQKNAKCYIGSSINPRKRWQKHLWALRHGRHCNPHLQAAFGRYGEVAFSFAILESAKSEQLLEREQYYLDTRSPEYNIAPTAGSPLGRPCGPETRRKMSEAQKGERNPNYGKRVQHSKETRRKISMAVSGKRHPNYGKHHSEETKRKMSLAHTGERNANYGKHPSEEARSRMREAHKGKCFSAEHCRKISEGLIGRTFTNEHRRNISKARKAYWHRVRAAKGAGG